MLFFNGVGKTIKCIYVVFIFHHLKTFGKYTDLFQLKNMLFFYTQFRIMC